MGSGRSRVILAKMQAPNPHQRYTVDDYMQWPDEFCCELLDGVIYDMSPAPSIRHQDISGNLFTAIKAYLKQKPRNGGDSKPCRVFHAPIDVVLAKDTLVQPDIVIVCDDEKLRNEQHILGAPDAVVEILSKSTALKDRREKRALYQRFGVREYLIIDPFEEYAEYYLMQGEGAYHWPLILGPEDSVVFQCLAGASFSVEELFTG